MTDGQSPALESQITQLEQQLAQKRAELGREAAAPYERTEVHEAVTEQMQQVVPAFTPPAPAPSGGPSWQDPALAGQVQQLVDVAFTKSIQEAITQAIKTGNPALLDAFHDVLVDQLHQELLNRQKLQPAP